jgi:hypothetical protein
MFQRTKFYGVTMRLVTDEVLTEVLNFLSTYGQGMRKRALLFVQDIFNNPNI